MDKKLLELLVCPKCNGKLDYDRKNNELICPTDKLAYPLHDGIPVMLEQEARPLQESAKTE